MLLLLTGCSESESAQARTAQSPAPVSVTVAPVIRDSAQRTVDVVGNLHGDEEATISAKVSGRIAAVYHDIGDRVPPGQVLAQIETRDYELARSQRELAMRESLSKLGLREFPPGEFDTSAIPTVRKARLAAENAEGRFQRGKQLFEQTPPRLSEQEFADLQTAWEVAQNEFQVQILQAQSTLAEARARQAELELAEQQLADTIVRAPAEPASAATQPAETAREYAITERMVTIGEFVRDGAALFRLIDDDPIKLRANVPERFAGEVRVGQTVRVWIEAYTEPFLGRVTRVNPQVDPANRNFVIEALISNPEHQLKPGAFARASIETRIEPDVIFVPSSAVVTFAGVNRVFIVDQGKAAERIVELGPRRGEQVEVRSGLKGDETIVVSDAEGLTPGTPLKIQPATAPSSDS